MKYPAYRLAPVPYSKLGQTCDTIIEEKIFKKTPGG
jgi:hypothetical protein